MENKKNRTHFKGQDPLSHVVEAQKEGIIASSEVHGQEPSGQWVAFIDSLRDMVIFFLLIYLSLFVFNSPSSLSLKTVALASVGYLIWKGGRSALLGWSRLERLHRIVDQERWEIEHHRQQEREELTELYRAKGFSGRLLEEVIDVLMSDGDRLLRVMIEEELGLSLEKQEHPLLQASGAFLGGGCALVLLLLTALYFPPIVVYLMGAFLLLLGGYLAARVSDNEPVPSIVWHFGIGFLSVGFTYFLLQEYL